jgi:uncharacterized membrane protein
MKLKTNNLAKNFSHIATRFFGSWWAVAAQFLFIIVWFSLGLKMELFMLWISLEAIFIWVVYLAASQQREERLDRMGALQQVKIKEKMLDNLSIGEKQNQKIDRIIKLLYDLQEEVKSLKKN